MELSTTTKTKVQIRCNMCKAGVGAKNGDWFFQAKTPDRQIFLCRACESKKKGTYVRAIPSSRSWV